MRHIREYIRYFCYKQLEMILKALKIASLILFLILSYLNYQKFGKKQTSLGIHQLDYNKNHIQFKNDWRDDQFQQKRRQFETVSFLINRAENCIEIKVKHKNTKQHQPACISFSDLQIEIQDAISINSVQKLSMGSQKAIILKIQSQYFTIIFNFNLNLICYEKIHVEPNYQTYFIDSTERLWIVTYPKYNLLIFRVFATDKRQLITFQKYAFQENVQMLSDITEVGNSIQFKFLTFGRNNLIYEVNKLNFAINSQKVVKTHSFTYLTEKIEDAKIYLQDKLSEAKSYEVLQNILYQFSAGIFGKKLPFRQDRKIQQDFGFEALDLQNNIVIEFDKSYQSNSIVSFGEILLPMRTPVFISRSDQQKLMPFDELLNRTKNDESLPSVDFKLYGIKSKNLQILKNRHGLYRMLPDSSVHFLSFDRKILTFYPKQNLKQEDYYLVRIPKGGIALKGSQIKGIFEDVPVPDQFSPQLKYGYSKSEIYQELTTSGNQILQGIYEAHVVHKGLFVKLIKNRVELISSLHGKSVLTHNLQKKQKYQYSTSYIENNQFWVFEHKAQSPPLITKYEMFVNSSSPKGLLFVKRNYQINAIGRITRVQKCIDYFYYFTYITEDNKFGMARIHHALMSNRQARADGKYAGAFDKMMVAEIKRNNELNVLVEEEELFKMQIDVGSEVLRGWKQLQLKHQYKILPVRVFYYKNQYYIINIRKLLLKGFDYELERIQADIYFKSFVYFSAFSVAIAIAIAIPSKKKSEGNDIKTKQENDGKQTNKEKSKEKEKQEGKKKKKKD